MMIKDLEMSKELARGELSAVRGGSNHLSLWYKSSGSPDA